MSSKTVQQLEAQARWRNKNRARISELNKEYYAANRENEKQRITEYRKKNPDKVSEWNTARKVDGRSKEQKLLYRKRHPDRVKAARRAQYAKNREKELAGMKQWKLENPALAASYGMKRLAQKLQATPAWADKGKILELYEAAQAATEIFETPIHVDHIVPLRSKYVCGLHCEANLRLLPGLDNQRKSNRVWPDMPESLAA